MNTKSSDLVAKQDQKNTSKLLQAQTLDQKGIFAHPLEDIEDFIKDGESYPQVSSSIPSQVKTLLKYYFDVDATHIAIEESAKFLLPWEIACCIIEEDGHPTVYTRPRAWFFRNIPQEAILSHELIHAFRARLQSNIFEEYVAFDATRLLFPKEISYFRTIFGPLFQNPREAILVCLLLFIINLLPWFFDSLANVTLLLSLTTLIIAYPCLRCAYYWHIWNKAKRTLLHQFSHLAWKILVRLSDSEIYALARLQKGKEAEFFRKKSQESWRWAIFDQRITHEL